MKYQIHLNDKDYLQFNIFYATHSKVGKHSIRMARLAFPLVAAAAVFIFILAGAAYGLIIGEAVILAIASLYWELYLPKYIEKSVRKNIERIKTDGKMPYHAHSEIELLDSMIIERSAHGQIRVSREEIEAVYDEPEYLYIFYGAAQAFLIPKRCLGGCEKQAAAFITETYQK